MQACTGVAEHSHRHFSHECLCVGLAFAGDDEAGAEEGVIKVDQVQNSVDARLHGSAKARHQGSGKTSGGTGTRQGRYIHARLLQKGMGLPMHTLLQHLYLLRGGSLLWRKHLGGAARAYKWRIHIAQKFKGSAPKPFYPWSQQHTGTSVTGGRSAEAHHKPRAALVICRNQQLPKAQTGCLQGIPLGRT